MNGEGEREKREGEECGGKGKREGMERDVAP